MAEQHLRSKPLDAVSWGGGQDGGSTPGIWSGAWLYEKSINQECREKAVRSMS